MPKQVRFRRGTTAQHATFTGADGEGTFDTTKKCLVLHDGVTAGGHPQTGYLKLDTGVEESFQTLQNSLHITGSDGDGWSLLVTGAATFETDIEVNQSVMANLFRNRVNIASPVSPVTLRFDQMGFWTLALTGDVTFTLGLKNSGASITLLLSAGASLRNLTWPSGMKWVGAAAPATLAANKVALLQLWCFGATDSEVVVRYLAEP